MKISNSCSVLTIVKGCILILCVGAIILVGCNGPFYPFWGGPGGGGSTSKGTEGEVSGETKGTVSVEDFDISGIGEQPFSNVQPVTIVPKADASTGKITVWYAGIDGTSYEKSTTIPAESGTYRVTFDVAETDKFNAASGLQAGILKITDEPIPIDDLEIKGLTAPVTGAMPDTSITTSIPAVQFDFVGIEWFNSSNIFDPVTGPFEPGMYEVHITLQLKDGYIFNSPVPTIIVEGFSPAKGFKEVKLKNNGCAVVTIRYHTIGNHNGDPSNPDNLPAGLYSITGTAPDYVYTLVEDNPAANNLVEVFNYIQNHPDSYSDPRSYIMVIDDNITVDSTRELKSGKLTLYGKGEERKVSLAADVSGSMFELEFDGGIRSKPELILSTNITLQGKNGNSAALVQVDEDSTFTMEADSKITGNIRDTAGWGSAVLIQAGGIFNMNGGEISGNGFDGATGVCYGGGVYLLDGTFTMSGDAKISGNYIKSSSNHMCYGGGVYLSGGTFTMRRNAKISGNYIENSATSSYGGGVAVYSNGTFSMLGGEISENRLVISGVGEGCGGGVMFDFGAGTGTFSKSGGTIYGKDSNKASADGKGHAIYTPGNYKDSDSLPGDEFSCDRNGVTTGNWD